MYPIFNLGHGIFIRKGTSYHIKKNYSSSTCLNKTPNISERLKYNPIKKNLIDIEYLEIALTS